MRFKSFLILSVSFLLLISVVYGGIELDCGDIISDCESIYDYWNLETPTGINGKLMTKQGVVEKPAKVNDGIFCGGDGGFLSTDISNISSVVNPGLVVSLWVYPEAGDGVIYANNLAGKNPLTLSLDNGMIKCEFDAYSVVASNTVPLHEWSFVSCGFFDKDIFVSLDGSFDYSPGSQMMTNGAIKFCTNEENHFKGYIDEITIDIPQKRDLVEGIISNRYKAGIFPSINKFSAATKAIVNSANKLSEVTGFELFDEVNNIKIKYDPNKKMNLVDQEIDSAITVDKGFVSFDTTNLDPTFSSETLVTIGVDSENYVLSYDPGIFINKQDFLESASRVIYCGDGSCNPTYSVGPYGPEVSFEVASFSSYGAESSAPLANHAIYLGAGSNFSDITGNAIYLNSTGADGVYVDDSHYLDVFENIINTSGDNSSAIFIRDSSFSEFEDNMLITTGSGSAGVLFSSDSDPLKTHSNEFINIHVETNDYSFIGPELGYNVFEYFNNYSGISWNMTSANATFNFIEDNIYLQQNLVGLPNDPGLMDFNSTAMISFFNLSYPQQPFLLKDGTRCDDTDACNISSWNETSGKLIAVVAGFSNYTTEAGIPSYNLTVFIDGVEGTTFEDTADLYNVRLLVTDQGGVPVEGASVGIREKNGRNIGMPVLQLNNAPYSLASKVTNLSGEASFVITPTLYALNPSLDYNLSAVIFDDSLGIFKTQSLDITNYDSADVDSGKPITDIAGISGSYDNVNLIAATFKSSIEDQVGIIHNIEVNDSGTHSPLNLVWPGIINIFNITLKNSTSGLSLNGTIHPQERQGWLINSLEKASGDFNTSNQIGNFTLIGDEVLDNFGSEKIMSSELFYLMTTNYGFIEDSNLTIYARFEDGTSVPINFEVSSSVTYTGSESPIDPALAGSLGGSYDNINLVLSNIKGGLE